MAGLHLAKHFSCEPVNTATCWAIGFILEVFALSVCICVRVFWRDLFFDLVASYQQQRPKLDHKGLLMLVSGSQMLEYNADYWHWQKFGEQEKQKLKWQASRSKQLT